MASSGARSTWSVSRSWRASATTSSSSVRVPQLLPVRTDSGGHVKKLNGAVPPARPTTTRWPLNPRDAAAAPSSSGLALVRRDVGDDDPRRRQQPEELDRHLPEAARADDEGRVAADEPPGDLLDRAVRREARVGQRRHVGRVEVADADEMARARHDVALGVAAGRAEAAPAHRVAELLLAAHADAAHPAAPAAVDDDRLAGLEAGRARPERLDPARVLVAHDLRAVE
jgi:hypothetical protein